MENLVGAIESLKIHDCLNYSEEEIKLIIQQAQIFRNEQN